MSPLKIVVLIGGSGTNLQRLIDLMQTGELPIEIQAVISHRPEAYGLERAQRAKIPALCVNHKAFDNRAAFEEKLAELINEFNPDLIVLAGFMRILSSDFVAPYLGKLINIHPSRLPHFQGLNTHQRVLEANHTEHGASVHYVTADLDGGPVIAQTALTVASNDTAETLKEKVQETEYELYPQVIRWFAEKRLSLKTQGVYLDGSLLPMEGVQLHA